MSYTSFRTIWKKKIGKYLKFGTVKTDVCSFCHNFHNKCLNKDLGRKLTKEDHSKHLDEVALRYYAYKKALQFGVSIIHENFLTFNKN